jgi:hypothetical protein
MTVPPGMAGEGCGYLRAMAITDEVQRLTSPLRRWAKVQAHEYSPEEDRPLGGLLGAMGTYLTLTAAGAAAVRASGRELPTRIPLGDAVLLTVATFRIARTIAKDPVASPLRAPFTTFQGQSGEAEIAEEIRVHGGVKHAIGELVTCPFCLAQWTATALVFGYATMPQATRLAALTMTMVAVADVGQFAYDSLQQKAMSSGPED